MKNNRIAASWDRISLSPAAKERIRASVIGAEREKGTEKAGAFIRRRWLVPVIVLLTAVLLGTAAYAVSVLIRRAEPYEIHHKVENFEYYGGVQPKWYLESHVLPAGEKPVVTVYPEDELLRDYPPNINYMNGFSNETGTRIYYLLGCFPTPNVRKVESEKGIHYYVMYMTEKGARYYLFFDETGMPFGYPVYLTEMREYRDFSALKPGDPIEKAERIDGTASVYRSYFRTFEEVKGNTAEEKNQSLWELNELYYSYPLAGVHYLADGLLEIRYEFNEDGDYVIESLHYAPDYTGIVPELELFSWPDLSLWNEEDWEDIRKSYEEDYNTLLKRDYSYGILQTDEPGGEIVIADIEANPPPKEILADEIKWSLPVYVRTSGQERQRVFVREDFGDDEILTIMASRKQADEADGPVETIFAGGVPLSVLAEKAGAGDFRQVRVTVENGEEEIFTREELLKNDPVVAWIRNKQYAMDHSETGLSLAVSGEDVSAFRFTVKSIVFE